MAPFVPHRVPEWFYAGDTVSWKSSFNDYDPAEGWTLGFAFAGPSTLQVDAITDPDNAHGWLTALTPSQSEGFIPGVYRFTGRVTSADTTVVKTVSGGQIEVRADPNLAAGNNQQSFLERQLAAVEAVLEGRIPADVESYSIAGRSITKSKFTELWKIRNSLAYAVNRERRNGALLRDHLIRFGPVKIQLPEYELLLQSASYGEF